MVASLREALLGPGPDLKLACEAKASRPGPCQQEQTKPAETNQKQTDPPSAGYRLPPLILAAQDEPWLVVGMDHG